MATKFRKTEDGMFGVVRDGQFLALAEMTTEEYEAFLRKNKVTGMMAVAFGRKRREGQAFLAKLQAEGK